MSQPIPDAALNQLFRTARSYNTWQDKPVSDATLRELYDLARFGPTATNSNPGRFVFVRSPEAKERLKPHLMAGNVDKVMTAPCCVIVALDTRFYELMPKLFPARDYKAMFENNAPLVADLTQRNSTLQGAYLMLAARALGLDCGPMSGFNQQGVNSEFFPDGRWHSNFLCTLGYGSEQNLFPRNPRLDFEEACQLL